MKKYLRLSLLAVCCAATFAPFAASGGPILNFGTRGDVGPGHKVLVNEFVITGDQPKTVLVRTTGPGLGTGALQDPVLEIRNASGEKLVENDNWKTSQRAQIEETGLAPTSDLDAAIRATLSPGSYTAIMRGNGDAVGVGLNEFFDLQPSASSVPALGSRVDLEGNVGTPTAFSVFHLSEQRSVVVRVLGPSLGQGTKAISGTVADPHLIEITDQNGTVVPGSQSDNWKTQGGSSGTGLEPSNDAESAVLLQNLSPGSYTTRVTGKNADGIVFVQVYALPYNTPLDPAPTTGQGSQPATSCVTAPTGLTKWFTGDGDATDLQGGNSGYFRDNANAAAPGKVGAGFGMDGNGDYIEVFNEAAIRPSHLTVSAWVKFDSLESTRINAPPGHQYLVMKHNSRQNGSGFEEAYALVKVRQGGKDVFNFVLTTANTTRASVLSTTGIQVGQFYHVAGTFDGQTVRLYVDGVLKASAPANFTLDYSSQSLYLGRSAIAGFEAYFNGVLDEVQIYDRALSAVEIGSIGNAGSFGLCKFTPGLWVAGRDLLFNEKPDNAAEANARNTVVPEWSYGTRAQAATTELTLFRPDLHANRTDGLEGWYSNGAVEGVLAVNVKSAPAVFDPGVKGLLSQQLDLHPTADNRFIVVRWTAPADGSYRAIAEWLDLDTRNGNGASAHVTVNGTEVFGRKVGPDQVGPERFVGQEWDDGGNAEMPAQTFKLKTGDTIDFAVGSRGNYFSDSTAFNAVVRRVAGVEIPNAPPESRTEEGVRLPEGSDVTLEVAVDSVQPVEGVILRENGTRYAEDTTAPYSFTVTNLEAGFYSFDVVAVDGQGVESVSERINVNVVAIPAAAAARTTSDGSEESPQKVAAVRNGGRTYICTQSGSWENPATWGGEGVPGRNDYAVISAGFAVNAQDVEVDDFSLFGSLVIGSPGFPRRFVVYDKFYAAGKVEGGDPSSQLVVFNRMDCLSGAVKFRDLSLFVSGETIVTNNGAIDAVNCVLVVNGKLNLYSPPGTNKPVVVRVDQAQIQGAVALDNYAQLITSEGLISDNGAAIIGNDSAGIIGNDSAGVVSNHGGSVIGTDGASILGVRGEPLIGLDGGTLIGLDGGTLIGLDGGTLIGNAGGTLTTERGTGVPERHSSLNRNASGDTVTQLSVPGAVTLERATLSGKINVVGNLVNQSGFVSPGNSAGKITVSGTYTQGPAGTLLLEIGGTQTSPLQYDQLKIVGNANLDGNLIVKTIDGFMPQSGDTFSPLTFGAVTGNFASVTSNAQVSFGANGMTTQVSGPNPPAPKALNIATRMKVETGDNALIAGFIITGSQPKKVIIRGIGPSLPFGGVLADPTLNLDNGAVTNDNWRTNQEQEIIATTIPPSNNLEPAIVATLNPGPHTAILRGSGNATGIGVVEVYDLDSGSPVQLANISSRGFVQSGDDVMIGGFIIGGTYPAKVIVRAIGPSLPFPGILADPTLELVNSNGGRITNDNWRATQEAEIIATTVPPTNDNEAAIVATLAPGNYTAIVRGVDDTTGIAVVEAYNLQ